MNVLDAIISLIFCEAIVAVRFQFYGISNV